MYSKIAEKGTSAMIKIKPMIESWINATFFPTGIIILAIFFGILSYHGLKNFNREILLSILENPILRLATLNMGGCLFTAILFHRKTKVIEWVNLVLMGLFTLMCIKGLIEVIPNPF